MLRESSLA